MTTEDLPRIGTGEIGSAATWAEPEHLRVTVRQKNARRDWVEEDVAWPAGWPLPEQGAIFQGHVIQGWISHTEWDVTTLRIIIVLR